MSTSDAANAQGKAERVDFRKRRPSESFCWRSWLDGFSCQCFSYLFLFSYHLGARRVEHIELIPGTDTREHMDGFLLMKSMT